MKNSLKLLALIFILGSCNKKAGKKDTAIAKETNISGVLAKPDTLIKKVFLGVCKRHDKRLFDSFDVLDSATVRDNEFSFRIKNTEDNIYRIYFGAGQDIYVVAGTQDVQIKDIDLASRKKRFSLSGSKDLLVIEKIEDMLVAYNTKIAPIQDEFTKADKEKNKPRMEELQKENDEINDKMIKKIQNLIVENMPSVGALYGTKFMDVSFPSDYKFLKTFVEKVQKEMPESIASKNFIEYMSRVSNTDADNELQQNNKPAADNTKKDVLPNFTLLNDQEKPVSLESFKGKYVLIDFWASWCKPCRAENPNVVKAYNQFKNKDFEVLGVSLDRDEKAWKSAIVKDNLKWQQVWDKDGEVSDKYGVSYIPMNFLVDKNGVVIARNLRGEALEKALQKYLN